MKKLYRGCRKLEKKRIIPAFLVLCVIFAIVPRPGAAAAGMSGLEVIGQTAMTQQTFTDLSVIGADSCGLTDAIKGTKNPAQSIGEWIKGYWDSWLLRQQLTWGTVLNIAAAGARYTGNGDLLFNSQLSDLFTRFYNWLWDGEDGPNIKENAEISGLPGEGNITISSQGVPSEYLYNYDCVYEINAGNELKYGSSENDSNIRTISCTESGYIVVFPYGGAFFYMAISPVPGKMTYKRGANTIWEQNLMQTQTKDGEIYIYTWGNNPGDSPNGLYFSIPMSHVYKNGVEQSIINMQHVDQDIGFLLFGGYAIGDDNVLGDPDKLGGLTGADTNILAPPDIINWPDFGGNSGYVDINDYIGGLRDSIESEDGTADVNITDSEGVETTQTMEIDQTSDIPVESETTAEMVNQGEVISTATPSTELADYTIDLRNYFPFCIPWDLYDMVTLLVADPVAPRVQYPFVIEPLNVNYTIDLDFSEFDSVAAVLRTMELLAAGIGLAIMTKRLIQGGD